MLITLTSLQNNKIVGKAEADNVLAMNLEPNELSEQLIKALFEPSNGKNNEN
jgi:hypothetical protein